MEQQQQLVDNVAMGDENSWIPISSKSSTSTVPYDSSPSVAGDVDRAFFNEVDEMMSLVHFVIDKNPRSSYTRSGHMIHTKTPSKGPNVKMRDDRRGRSANITLNSKKHKDQSGSNLERCSHCLSVCTPLDLTAEQDLEAGLLRDHIEDLKKKLAEKDELLKQFEAEKNHMISIQSKLDEMNHLVEKKDSLIKSVQLQLANAQIAAADKQASFERMQWELRSSNCKVEKLEAEVGCVHEQISSVNIIFQEISSQNASSYSDDQDHSHAPSPSPIDGWDERNVEEAMGKYMSAVADLKDNRDEESMAEAVAARLYLHSLIF